MPTAWRIRDRATFEALRTSGRRGRSGPVSVTFLPPGPGDPAVARVALAVGRRAGGAVARNRIRRRLRAAAGLAGLGPGAYLIAAGPEVIELPFDELVGHLRRAVAEVRP